MNRLGCLVLSATLAANVQAAIDESLPDPTFGAAGYRYVPFNAGGGDNETLVKTLAAADGSLYLVGTASVDGGSRIAITRLSHDGKVVLDFGTNGRYVGAAKNETATGAALDPQGAIVVAANANLPSGDIAGRLCRVSTSGEAVNFAGTNKSCITLAFNALNDGLIDQIGGITIDAQGRILVTGASQQADGVHLALARLTPNGNLDLTFSGDGRVTRLGADFMRWSGAAVAVNGDKMLVVGSAQRSSDGKISGLTVRFDDHGAFIEARTTFDNAIGEAAFTDIIRSKDSKFLVVGGSKTFDNGAQGLLAKLNVAGNLDKNFANGWGFINLTNGAGTMLRSVVQQSDGKIVVAGSTSVGNGSVATIGRYDASGQPDFLSFNPDVGGYRELPFAVPGKYGPAISIALQQGLPVVGGWADAGGGDYDMVAVRLAGDRIFADDFEPE